MNLIMCCVVALNLENIHYTLGTDQFLLCLFESSSHWFSHQRKLLALHICRNKVITTGVLYIRLRDFLKTVTTFEVTSEKCGLRQACSK